MRYETLEQDYIRADRELAYNSLLEDSINKLLFASEIADELNRQRISDYLVKFSRALKKVRMKR